MDLTIQWFWFIKLILVYITLFVLYKAYKAKVVPDPVKHDLSRTKFKINKISIWDILLIILIIFQIMMPVKIEPATAKFMFKQNMQIERHHSVVPPKVTDTTFEDNAKAIGNLTGED
jgi:Na+/H+ antiporter NhaD/arsenite permease-like protein